MRTFLFILPLSYISVSEWVSEWKGGVLLLAVEGRLANLIGQDCLGEWSLRADLSNLLAGVWVQKGWKCSVGGKGILEVNI